MPRRSKVRIDMKEDMKKRSEDRQKFVTKWVEVNGRLQRQAVFRAYATPVHANKIDLPEKAQADFEDTEVTEYLATTLGGE